MFVSEAIESCKGRVSPLFDTVRVASGLNVDITAMPTSEGANTLYHITLGRIQDHISPTLLSHFQLHTHPYHAPNTLTCTEEVSSSIIIYLPVVEVQGNEGGWVLEPGCSHHA